MLRALMVRGECCGTEKPRTILRGFFFGSRRRLLRLILVELERERPYQRTTAI
jgi:hypothetical protein